MENLSPCSVQWTAHGKNCPISWHFAVGTELERWYPRRYNLDSKDRNMKKQYKFAELTKEEKEYHEMILLEEVDVQAWFAIAFSSIFDEELFVTVQ